MLTCPKCVKDLSRTRNETGPFWRCSRCEGRAISIPLLRKTILRDYIDLLWLRARKGQGTSGRGCPACYHPMSEVCRSSNPAAPNLDICRSCRLMWFDPKEYEEILAQSRTQPLSPKEKEFINLNQAQVTRDMWMQEWSLEAPEEAWKYLPALFGIPVEYEETLFQRAPWITRGLVILFVAIFGYDLRSLDSLIHQYGLIPSEIWRYGGLTLLTSFFLHAGNLHLFFNSYFLYTFGDNVEDYLGKGRFILLVLLAGFSATLAHVASNMQSQMPLVGFDYIITGLLVFYVLRFPKAQMGLLLLLRSFRWFRLPAFEALIVWIIIQALGTKFQIAGFTHISVWGHLTSAGVALFFWIGWKKK